MHLNLKKIKKQYFFRNIVYDDYDILLINENTQFLTLDCIFYCDKDIKEIKIPQYLFYLNIQNNRINDI